MGWPLPIIPGTRRKWWRRLEVMEGGKTLIFSQENEIRTTFSRTARTRRRIEEETRWDWANRKKRWKKRDILSEPPGENWKHDWKWKWPEGKVDGENYKEREARPYEWLELSLVENPTNREIPFQRRYKPIDGRKVGQTDRRNRPFILGIGNHRV